MADKRAAEGEARRSSSSSCFVEIGIELFRVDSELEPIADLESRSRNRSRGVWDMELIRFLKNCNW